MPPVRTLAPRLRLRVALARVLLLLLLQLPPSLVQGQQTPLPGAQQFQQGEALFDQQRYAQAVPLLVQAATLEHAAAQARLGEMFNWGAEKYPPIAQDYTRAAGYVRSSAAQGYALGQTLLASMHRFGYGGVLKSDRAAVELFRLAAAQGEADGQEGLGYVYSFGHGVVQDKAQALSFYRAAADQGDAAGQFNVAVFYYNGEGGAKLDPEQALHWNTLSANQDYPSAVQNLPAIQARCPGACADRAAALVAQFTRKTPCAASGFTAANFCAGRGTPVEFDDSVQRICVCQSCSVGFTGARCQTTAPTATTTQPAPAPPTSQCRDQLDGSCLGQQQSGWKQFTCSYAKDFCSNQQWGREARRCCPLACGVCSFSLTPPPPTTTPPRTPVTTPVPTPRPTSSVPTPAPTPMPPPRTSTGVTSADPQMTTTMTTTATSSTGTTATNTAATPTATTTTTTTTPTSLGASKKAVNTSPPSTTSVGNGPEQPTEDTGSTARRRPPPGITAQDSQSGAVQGATKPGPGSSASTQLGDTKATAAGQQEAGASMAPAASGDSVDTPGSSSPSPAVAGLLCTLAVVCLCGTAVALWRFRKGQRGAQSEETPASALNAAYTRGQDAVPVAACPTPVRGRCGWVPSLLCSQPCGGALSCVPWGVLSGTAVCVAALRPSGHADTLVLPLVFAGP